MEEIHLKSWEEFDERLKAFQAKRPEELSSKWLYRGQRHAKLSTTLERDVKEKLSLREYHRLISQGKPQIESVTGTDWSILSYPQGIDGWLIKGHVALQLAFGESDFQPTYSYMAYLRQHGFPSPFLDWTSSPYVAAFFAFRSARPCNEDVSIYLYLSRLIEQSTQPFIHRFGPYVRTHRRHFLQQSHYTICFTYDSDKEQYEYTPHEQAFSRSDPRRPDVWKFSIPSSERLKVLRILDGYNINAFSLFDSEDSLIETVALREIHLRGARL